MHIYKTAVKLHHTDAVGILFFSKQFELIHDAYESVLEKAGYGIAFLLKKAPFVLPIVHAESDYLVPLFVGEPLTIEVRVKNLGASSITFSYKLFNGKKQLVGTAKTVHVAINKKTRKKIPLPAQLRKALTKFS